MFCIVLYCFVLFCFVLFCFGLFCFVLFCFVLFFSKQSDAFLEPVKKPKAAGDSNASSVGTGASEVAKEKGGSDSTEEKAVRTKTSNLTSAMKAAGTPSREPSTRKHQQSETTSGADSAAASHEGSDDSDMNPINWGKQQVRILLFYYF